MSLVLRTCQFLEHHVLFLELLLGPEPPGHIPENSLDPDGLAIVRKEWRLHDLDVQSLSLGRDVLFDDVQNLAAFDDLPIVAAVFLGELARPEIEIGLAPNLLEAAPQLSAEALVREGEAPVEVLSQDVLRQCLDQCVVEDLGLAQFLDGPPRLGGHGFQIRGKVAMAFPQPPERNPRDGDENDQADQHDKLPGQAGRPESGERQDCGRMGEVSQ